MDFEGFRAKLYKYEALREGDDIQEDTVERIEPEYAESWPSEIHPHLRIELKKYLHKKLPNSDNRRPYQHQVQAIELALQGHDIVLESPTASGKTLAFVVPMLDALLRNPDSHALMIYQMNALSFDQLDKIRELASPLGISVDTYIRETGGPRREKIRDNLPRILLTNPEYLNDSFLGWREKHWNRNGFLHNLCYMVIDEMHLYHGYFGNNMTLLLRRFFSHLKRLEACPSVFLSTATCADPEKHASILTGRKVTHVRPSKDMRPRRRYVFVKPEDTDTKNWKNLSLRVERAALAILESNLRTLVFCPTVNFLENARSNCSRLAEKIGLDTSSLAVYHSRLPDDEKQQNRQKIKSGEHTVIFTTNALEVGLDIGGLDGIVLAGFPSNVMSAWQRIGRAGRSWASDAFVLYFAMNDPIDQFFVSDINSFLDKPLDELVVDPANEHMISNHIDSLMDETKGKIDCEDVDILGAAFYKAAVEAAKAYKPRVSRRSRRGDPPQIRLSRKGLRGDNSENYDLAYDPDSEPIGKNIPAAWKFRHAYRNAIFTFAGKRFQVYGHSDIRGKRKIFVEEAPPSLRTEADFRNYINEDDEFGNKEFGSFSIFYGEVNLKIVFDRYSVIEEDTDTILEREYPEPNESEFKRFNLHAFWIEHLSDRADPAALYTLLQLLRVGAWRILPSDRFDTSAYLRPEVNTVYLYENHKGGTGIVRRLFEVWPNALEEGIQRALNCPKKCGTGCPVCIEPVKTWDAGSGDIDKAAGIRLAEQLLDDYRRAT